MAKPFTSILCGIEGNPKSTEAARQATVLAAGEAKLHFLAVHPSFEMGRDYQKGELEKGLDEAAELAREAGVSPSTEMREGRYAVDVLRAASDGHDLLVIGTPRRKRVAGIMFGSTAIEAAHQIEGPLLIAKEPSTPDGFPDPILIATDGSAGSGAAVRMGAELATAFGASLELANVLDGTQSEGDEGLARQVAEVQDVTESEPSVTHLEGDAAREIVKLASDRHTSLIVCGRQGFTGLKSLGSVSEKVVSGAPCSVLVIPA